MTLRIEPMRPEDWDRVRGIYLEGIATGQATFETTAPAWEAWDAAHMRAARLVAREGEATLGWAALSPVSSRCVYAGVAEVSVYVAAAARGRGVGRALLAALIAAAEREGLWTLQAGIFPENEASLAVHRRCGFREVGRRERLGKLNGAWRDVLLLERRSPTVGL
ncbi:MAG: N-acetyltransferase [Acidobacteria bacterium]|nr:MAG: N-acetyltransferase [Acidobacteriota bacterium]